MLHKFIRFQLPVSDQYYRSSCGSCMTARTEQAGEDVQPSPEKLTYWTLTDVDYDGMPFQLVGRIVYACHQGKDKARKQKEKYKAQKQEEAAAELREPVDAEVEKHILKLALDGARRVSEFRRHINTFVKDELLRGQQPPPLTRRHYNPTDQEIRNILSKTKRQTRNSEDDQVNLQILTSRWAAESGCCIKYRSSQVQEDGTTTKFLFCYQTHWQQRLLHIYGQQMCLLDATYRTCRYSMPLFFLCVRTNVCYVVIGSFIVQKETTVDVQEALNIFKEWNPDWTPSHFMVDKSDVEINALNREFPEAKVVLCDYHREKAWGEWCRKVDHGVRECQDALLKLLRAIAASTQDEYYARLQDLEESEIWKRNVNVQTWLSIHWLPEADKWVQAFRADEMTVAIYTNNGIERQNETLKYKHLEGYKNCSLSVMVTRLVTSFLPETHRKYIELNVRYSPGYSLYNTTLPTFLKNRPRDMVEHILSRYEDARLKTNPDSIVNRGEGLFDVKSTSHSTHQTTFFGNNDAMPWCTCKDWQRHKLPCKHLCAVFQHVPGWSWESLPSKYKNNPIFSLDAKYLGHVPNSDGPAEEEDDDAMMSTLSVDVQPA
ncbi:Hypp8400 [Branchiostoma lanceolatum]|uniref:Hypp8400 protein n=1 Tax=Branchiostoma lanceolatum TaxID=7740 RepID=A0A8K0EHN4_BRALA|nr:Hypp8400 [Branchiostoma lanceolatum]